LKLSGRFSGSGLGHITTIDPEWSASTGNI
jgi:hypothetical protein